MSSAAPALAAGLCALAYLAGSVPFSYLVARACGVDLRTVGSGKYWRRRECLAIVRVWAVCRCGCA
ncbi:MAG: hypothetical protein U0Z44_15545 [Kouleothrix sp.]